MIFSLLMTVASCLPSVFVSTNSEVEDVVTPLSSRHCLVENSANILDGAQVTVFTHGMGGTYRDWLAENQDSPYFLNNDYLPLLVSTDNVFVFRGVSTDEKPNVVSLNKVERAYEEVFCVENGEEPTIHANDHIVLIYDGFDDTKVPSTNEEVYAPFEIALDTVLAGLSDVLGGTPQVNLIGHSRGGLVNLLYAIDHPRVVRNLISIGTPYWGSTWGDALISILNVLPEGVTNISPEPYAPLLDPASSVSLYQKWRNEPLCNNIRATAISCTQSFTFFSAALMGEFGVIDAIHGFFCRLFPKLNISKKCIIDLLNRFFFFLTKGVEEAATALTLLAKTVGEVIRWAIPGCPIDDYVEAFTNVLNILLTNFHATVLTGWISADGLVNYHSQKGTTWDLSINYPFRHEDVFFESYYPDDLEPIRSSQPFVLHNFETKAPSVKSRVLSVLAEDPGSRHVHKFKVGTDANHHFLTCVCGAKTLNKSHSLEYDHSTDLGDYFSCGCGYSERKDHVYDFEFDDSTHHGQCYYCERVLYGEHVLSARRDFKAAYHYAFCVCGYSQSEPHQYIGTKRRCPCGRIADSSLELNL